MAKYVDGYVIPIKKSNLALYKKDARLGCKVWMDHGALDYYECIGDDLRTPYGQTFIKLCKLKPSETVVFAFVVYKSKAHRNRVNAKVMRDPRMNHDTHKANKMPFDLKRFVIGGFKVAISS